MITHASTTAELGPQRRAEIAETVDTCPPLTLGPRAGRRRLRAGLAAAALAATAATTGAMAAATSPPPEQGRTSSPSTGYVASTMPMLRSTVRIDRWAHEAHFV